MELNQKIKKVIDYIEDHLCDDIDYGQMAQLVGTSSFHLQRVFSFLFDISLAEYIRFRKLTRAGYELKKSDNKIIDIARKYGYDSQSSFSRAFKKFHGVTPLDSRKKNVILRTYPSFYTSMNYKGAEDITFKIVKKEAFKLFGKKDIVLPMQHKDCIEFIKAYARSVVADGTHDSINIAAGFAVGDDDPFHLLHGIFFKEETDAIHFMYGWDVGDQEIGESFTFIDVPKATWIVFSFKGEHLKGLHAIWTYLYSNWFLTSGYEIRDEIIIEKEGYLDDEQTDYVAELWLALKE